MEIEQTQSGPLLSKDGHLEKIGWSRKPVWDCNLESACFYKFRSFQRFRLKRWDYYAIFTPRNFFSATIADLGYAGDIFVYTLDYSKKKVYEEEIIVPLGRGIQLPRNSTEGNSYFKSSKVELLFSASSKSRTIKVLWPGFQNGRGIEAEISLNCPDDYESMNIVIPIGRARFYYNRKINCMPAHGYIKQGDSTEILEPNTSVGSLDWGRGVWDYKSFWNWASSSGYLPDGRTVGLNFGAGFGDLTKASENAFILQNRVHKLGQITFDYSSYDYMKAWKFSDAEGRVDLVFKPFCERVAITNLAIITSEVHQLFGCYSGRVVTDSGETIILQDLVGFAEEHHAKW